MNTWIDREQSWLQFNYLVLSQVSRDDIPLNDKMKFIGIASNNLLEFVSVRYASKGDNTLRELIKEQKAQIQEEFARMNSSENIKCVIENKEDSAKLFSKLYSILTPIGVGKNKEVPRLNESDINFFVKLRMQDGDSKYCFLQLPHQVGRVYTIKEKQYFLEDIVEAHMDEIFNNVEVEKFVQFTVNKDYAEEMVHDTDVPIITRISDILKKRRENNFIFMDIKGRDEKLVNKLCNLLNIKKKNIFYIENDGALGLEFLLNYDHKKKDDIPKEKYTKFKPYMPEELEDEKSIFDYIEDEDLIVHHPYESYNVVVKFLKEAASDPKVISIKQTLYRVSDGSPIIEALCDAARNGIQVTIMLELLARFDERRNISLIRDLKESGVNIVYSLEKLKTHCKMCLIVRAGKRGIRTYSHIATGNYNEKSAKVYTDISYFTTKPSIGYELNSIFSMITGFSQPTELKSVSYSPRTLRQKLYDEMERVVNSKEQQKIIWIKINAISDKDIVEKIQTIAKEHPDVQFNIICRGMCSLPSAENIRIKSIVGRFLEHSRIYMFQVGNEWSVFISSADLLTRNLDRRVEILFQVSKYKKIRKIFLKCWEDTANTWWLDGVEWKRAPKEPYVNAQNEMATGPI